MSGNEFAHRTGINTTPERLWQALTDPSFTRRYWGVVFESDWKPGSTMAWAENGGRTVDSEQIVLEAEHHRRLSYAWHSFALEWAAAVGASEEFRSTLANEPRSQMTFEWEPVDGMVKLTVVHDGFTPRARCWR